MRGGTTTASERGFAARGGVGWDAALWFAVAGGPLAWSVHLPVVYFLAALPCMSPVEDTRLPLYLVTVATALIALGATVVGGLAWRRAGGQAGADLGEAGGRPGFMAISGLLLSGISVLGIIVESFAIPVLAFCE